MMHLLCFQLFNLPVALDMIDNYPPQTSLLGFSNKRFSWLSPFLSGCSFSILHLLCKEFRSLRLPYGETSKRELPEKPQPLESFQPGKLCGMKKLWGDPNPQLVLETTTKNYLDEPTQPTESWGKKRLLLFKKVLFLIISSSSTHQSNWISPQFVQGSFPLSPPCQSPPFPWY